MVIMLFALETWIGAGVLLATAVAIGAGPPSVVHPTTISLPLTFAAAALLASLADTLMPEAYEQGAARRHRHQPPKTLRRDAPVSPM